MNAIRPQFINGVNGHREWVVLPVKEFDWIMEELEDLEDIRLYDEAKRNDAGGHILFSDYLKNRRKNV